MTGYGEARGQTKAFDVQVEIRAVNNRFLKIVVRATEPFNGYELELERLIRKTIRRGSLTVQIRADRWEGRSGAALNVDVLKSYIGQIRDVGQHLGLDAAAVASMIGQSLHLPGVTPLPDAFSSRSNDEWALLEPIVAQAVDRLQAMRREEGRRMAEELLALRGRIAFELQFIRQRAPQVIADYRERLQVRIREFLGQSQVVWETPDLLKEVAVFADRCDISEELVRMDSHLDQFREVVQTETDSPGRKLEFLVQEMSRETNTIGSKASDSQIARHVVEIKANLERIRELVQNVE